VFPFTVNAFFTVRRQFYSDSEVTVIALPRREISSVYFAFLAPPLHEWLHCRTGRFFSCEFRIEGSIQSATAAATTAATAAAATASTNTIAIATVTRTRVAVARISDGLVRGQTGRRRRQSTIIGHSDTQAGQLQLHRRRRLLLGCIRLLGMIIVVQLAEPPTLEAPNTVSSDAGTAVPGLRRQP
jgi:hypothetical protein